MWNLLTSRLNQIQFKLRAGPLGALALRTRLPRTLDEHERTKRERQFYQLLLTRAIPHDVALRLEFICDVGCRNWSYAKALAESFPHAALLGVEVDPNRRYLSLHRRRDLATAHAIALALEGRVAECIFGDFRKVDLSSWTMGLENVAVLFFFPFVSANPCLKWGLPLSFVSFGELLGHAKAGASAPLILSAHQGEWESELAEAEYVKFRLKPTKVIIPASEFTGLWPSSHDVHVLVSRE